ncbi:MAG: hypothetical protein R3A51_21280 [Nannocystaceae bacterium]|nr:hypothetical protein [Myxococcales bacterium]
MTHVRTTLRMALGLLFVTPLFALAGSCGGDDGNTTSDEPLCDDPDAPNIPYRDDWVLEVDAEFSTAEDGVSTLKIGRREYMENFANRGDVEVLFDLPDDRIKIEMRRYTTAQCDAQAADEFSNMYMWAYASSSNPLPYSDMPDGAASETTCIPLVAAETDGKVLPDKSAAALPWKDGCYVYAYYDGKAQPARAGADFRVHLPAAYRGQLSVDTEDMDFESDYPLRGDITVTGLCNGGEFRLGSGTAKIKTCDASQFSIAPACSQAQIDACENYMVDGMPAAWDLNCGCDTFGQIKVSTHDAATADITVDFPNSEWVTATLENEASGQIPGEESACPVVVENCSGNCANDQNVAESPWKARILFNHPSEYAAEGSGYLIDARSSRCSAVAEVNGPDDFMDGVDPEPKRRGTVKLCTGCL